MERSAAALVGVPPAAEGDDGVEDAQPDDEEGGAGGLADAEGLDALLAGRLAGGLAAVAGEGGGAAEEDEGGEGPPAGV